MKQQPNSPKTKRVKILDTSIDEKRKISKWRIRDLDGDKELTMVMPIDDIGPAVGVHGDIPMDVLEDFLGKLIGKEINLQMKADISEWEEGDFKEVSENLEKLQQQHDVLDKYPYHEILDEMNEEENE